MYNWMCLDILKTTMILQSNSKSNTRYGPLSGRVWGSVVRVSLRSSLLKNKDGHYIAL